MIQPRDNSGSGSPSSGPQASPAALHSGLEAGGGLQAATGPAPCPPESLWLALCAGTVPEGEATQHLRHAAECPQCGPILREAAQLLTEEATPEEEALLVRMTTSSPAGQRMLAKRLYLEQSHASQQQKPAWHKRLFAWPALSLAGAACALAVAAIYVTTRPPTDATLLARAYDLHRSSELRIPGEKAGPLYSPTRGTGAGDTSSHDLLTLKLRAADEFEKNPNDPHVRQMQGRIALIDHDGEAARRQFEMAEALDSSLPGLKFDLASAEFELAENSGQGLGYARAIDLFSQHLKSVNGQDATALYDRGLCWERSAVSFEATRDFEAALKLEKDPAWRKQIEQHLARLKSAEPAAQTTPLTPQSFLAVPPSNPLYDAPGRYEQYLEVAGREWLSHRDDPQTAQALAALAALGKLHKDAWLNDFLAAPPSPPGDRALAQALSESSAGRYDDALALSTTAGDFYSEAHNRPGTLRAAANRLYDLHLLGRVPEALTQSAALARDPNLARYRWLALFIELEGDAALSISGNLSDLESAEKVRVAAEQAALPVIGLRAATFAAGQDIQSERYNRAWTTSTAGMRLVRSTSPTGLRNYQLIGNAEEVSKQLRLPWAEAGLAEAAAQAAGSSGQNQAAAYAYEQLAVSQLALNEEGLAAENFHRADGFLDKLGTGDGTILYRADWATHRAALKAHTQGIAAGLADFAQAEPRFLEFKPFWQRLDFFTQYSLLLRQAGRLPEAVEKLWIGLRDVEDRLAGSRSEAERTSWRRSSEASYQLLTLELAEQGQAGLALRAWEWHRSAPDRVPRPITGAGDAASLDRVFGPLPATPPGETTLVVARTRDRLIVWAVPAQGPLRMKIAAGDPEVLLREARSFARMAADANSKPEDLALLSSSLSRELLGPLGEPAPATLLRLDLDAALAGVPFAALPLGGRPLIATHPVVTLTPAWSTHAATTEAGFSAETSLVALQQAALPGGRGALPGEHDESSEISRYFPRARVETATLNRAAASLSVAGSPTLRASLQTAALIHYAGHGLDEAAAANTPGEVPLAIPHCRLAVLAACQSLHEREDSARDVPSFARIVMAAGAQQVLATQWDVDSEMTRRLMVHFYADLSRGISPPVALANAQQALLADPATQHPYFWSAFQIVTR